MKFILIGIPNVGKSTIGKQAAEELELPFYDIDKIVLERIELKSALNLFHIEFAQRMIQEQLCVLHELVQRDENMIIGTGASLPVDGNCLYDLPKYGTIIHITRDVESNLAHAKESKGMQFVEIGDDRKPIVGSEINISERVVNHYLSDLPLLDSIAEYTINGDNGIAEAAKQLVTLIRSLSPAT
jgi:shikimate kinase